MTEKRRFVDKELSWLSFNQRVLQEAANPEVPELQRLRYLGIYSNNLDEFFRVRVADVSRIVEFADKAETKERNRHLLEEIQSYSLELQEQFDATYLDVLKALHKRKIFIISETQLDKKQAHYLDNFVDEVLLPELHPVFLDASRRFPGAEDGSLYLAIKITSGGQVRYASIKVPTDRIDRFIEIPAPKGSRSRVFIVLENIIRFRLEKIFRAVVNIDSAEAYAFKLTLDAELELDEGINQSLINRMAQSLQKRRHADPERFVYDERMPEDMLKFLTKHIKLDKYDSLMPGSRYHNAKDFMGFPSVGPSYLEYRSLPTLPVPELAGTKHEVDNNIFDKIRQNDVLLYYPYHSFRTVTDLLKTAAIDPAVRSVKINLYRVAKNSRIVDALLNAKRNGKEVTAVVELQARFDEQANINWARRLTDGGVHVIFGVPGLKVHSKLISIARMEGNTLKYYSHIGTGNFNEKTSEIYTDLSLLTYNQEIGQDVANVFDFLTFNYRQYDYKHLLVSPHSNRAAIECLIQQEIDNAKQGKPAEIILKFNNLVDTRIVNLLYDASDAGVRVRVICRGMCSLTPGIKGVSENIEIISIVDRFLEHARIMICHNDGDPKYFISSADLMTRNLDHRVEVSVPVFDEKLKKRIQSIVDIQWCDNVKARLIDEGQTNKLRKLKINGKVRSQEVIHKYLETGKVPVAVQRTTSRLKKELKAQAKVRLADLKRQQKEERALEKQTKHDTKD
ncbi:Polyphosphate kinase [BD1-7 clade bacterium]|uniref:Polyphosphate kinase n=1 Tax=BD1-7 clade bacterium TaxID=2029982 RepID=A0A5S9QIL1_9GAMM|nr:Polyphosphate kinase [BD1-7 clade bacterium]